eukprot:Gb_36887 [translate_table: standard]
MKEITKPTKDAVTEVVRFGNLVFYCAEDGVCILGEGKFLVYDSFPGNKRNKLCMSSKIPLGVVLDIPPFNYSMNLVVSKIVLALIVGNGVVLKPPTQGIVATLHMVHCFHLAGFPKGLISCVTRKGSEIGDFLTMHPGVNDINFTGGDTGIAISTKDDLSYVGSKGPSVETDQYFQQQKSDDGFSAVVWKNVLNQRTVGSNSKTGDFPEVYKCFEAIAFADRVFAEERDELKEHRRIGFHVGESKSGELCCKFYKEEHDDEQGFEPTSLHTRESHCDEQRNKNDEEEQEGAYNGDDLQSSSEGMRGWTYLSVYAGSGLFENESSDVWNEFIEILYIGGINAVRPSSTTSHVHRDPSREELYWTPNRFVRWLANFHRMLTLGSYWAMDMAYFDHGEGDSTEEDSKLDTERSQHWRSRAKG